MMTGFVAEFSFCVAHAATNYVTYWLIFHTVLDYGCQNRDRRSQDTLILKKGLSTNCLSMIKYQWYIFCNANLTFQFGFWSITEWWLEK